jgi:hypothetical protein
MLDLLGGLLTGVLRFYAWTVGLGLVVLAAIMVIEGAVDLLRDLRLLPSSRSSMSRHNA